MGDSASPGLQRHFGLLQATALNVTTVVGAGVFVTIPLMLGKLPGAYALLGWLAAGLLMLVDGLLWSELGATLPGSGGSYVFLRECYGRDRWGRLMAFLFIWQFLISGPLEVASALIAIAQFSNALHPDFAAYNAAHTTTLPLWPGSALAVSFGPSRLVGLGLGVLILVLLYRRIALLGRLTVTFWIGVLGAIAWILVEGVWSFDPATAFATPQTGFPSDFANGLGGAMILAMYSYLGYYHVCYMGDEVRDPGRTVPRAILLTALLIPLLFVGVHLALLGTVPWQSIPTESPEADSYNLPAEFMRRLRGEGAAQVMALLLMWSCFGSAFAGLLGYSRIPYGAAREGFFFAPLARIHPAHRIPHISLLLVGGLTLFWSLFDLSSVISALLTTRILEQFLGQALGVALLRRREPDRPRPFRMFLYPLPCLLAGAGWLFIYFTSGWEFIALGLGTLGVGVVVYLLWAWRGRAWPFPFVADAESPNG